VWRVLKDKQHAEKTAMHIQRIVIQDTQRHHPQKVPKSARHR
jgi:hypothetical protein